MMTMAMRGATRSCVTDEDPANEQTKLKKECVRTDSYARRQG